MQLLKSILGIGLLHLNNYTYIISEVNHNKFLKNNHFNYIEFKIMDEIIFGLYEYDWNGKGSY